MSIIIIYFFKQFRVHMEAVSKLYFYIDAAAPGDIYNTIKINIKIIALRMKNPPDF